MKSNTPSYDKYESDDDLINITNSKIDSFHESNTILRSEF